MKAKKNWLKLTMAIVGALFLIGVSSTAQAQTVDYDPDYPNKAIGITDLIIDGTTYKVEFLEGLTAYEVYGDLDGDFDFTDEDSAAAAAGCGSTSRDRPWEAAADRAAR